MCASISIFSVFVVIPSAYIYVFESLSNSRAKLLAKHLFKHPRQTTKIEDRYYLNIKIVCFHLIHALHVETVIAIDSTTELL